MAAVVANGVDELDLSVVVAEIEKSKLAATRAMKTLMNHDTAPRVRTFSM